ncbi:Calpain-7 [Frankliniella fusca]|uniref:Calpain-7 n=1 Tax=Frankliniella fusca TaxID=407009 RepID=A0AAE1H574_9NEOP|nr:Calpain-7 [Frankliniella fusca]
MNAEDFLSKAQTSAQLAVRFDSGTQLSAALFYYEEAASYLLYAADLMHDDDVAKGLRTKAAEYRDRSKSIEAQLQGSRCNKSQSEDTQQLQRCRFLLSQALDADEAGLKDDAVELYTQAVELSIEAKKLTNNPDQQKKISVLQNQALERAETLKGICKPSEASEASTASPPSSERNKQFATSSESSSSAAHASLHRGFSAHLKIVGGSDSYSDEEKLVLLATSRINEREYVPFMSIDLKEKFQYAIPFSDRDGFLALSPKQKAAFEKWARPRDYCEDPVMVSGNVDPYSIKQTIVSDCSFVASLAISALYERRFKKRLITSIIYPKNRNKDPVYNPFGKYMIKLHINGVPRKVIIDDSLPMGRHGELLCSYSTNRSELWISLLEKAYMKVMGGYNFPGSNSNIDLHALTGWIPERKSILPNDKDFNSSALFDMLLTHIKKGNVLATVATGELSEQEAERAGLVPTHAYAVLDVEKINGVRLMKLKNPWSHLRWRGNYSELDTIHWTKDMKDALNFNPDSAAMFDNGVFWIDYESILRFYDVFYLNWDPQMFKYTYCIHQSWKAGTSPVKDAYNIGENPQFRLEVGPGEGTVWILLSRHITNIQDFKDNREFITVLVYKTEGKRVYYPYDPEPYIDGVRINSPHYLCKINLSENSSRKYTLVISQYEKMHTIYYTLRAYATCPFKLEKIRNPYIHSKVVNGEWKGSSAGGCANHPATYLRNPRYQVVLESVKNCKILLDLRGPKQYQMGLDIISHDSSPNNVRKRSSGVYRSGFVAFEVDDLPPGKYDIVPSTFLPEQEGPFILTFKSSCPFKLGEIQ